jgi:hypothetical protein
MEEIEEGKIILAGCILTGNDHGFGYVDCEEKIS